MQLGAFSISLAAKDLQASRAFYEAFGFKEFGGNAAQNWLILKNGDTIIGLFQGMFEKNMLTFNPGWDSNCLLYTPRCVSETVLEFANEPADASGFEPSL